MALSNAERQKRHRERLKARASSSTIPEPRSSFTGVDDPLEADSEEFLGMDRHEWAVAPEPLIDLCGLREAVNRWRLAYYARLGKGADNLFNERWNDIDVIRKGLGLKPRKDDQEGPYAEVKSLRNGPKHRR
ncbi:hypothetical protein [Xanthobacter sp. KR7-225]|uniref:hypothetical protein n=1 Tax=Xanthobacter sp. KR7-225 TaxID=3156613 RepID=UPI0032B47125